MDGTYPSLIELPTELQLEIFEHLPTRALRNLRHTCRSMAIVGYRELNARVPKQIANGTLQPEESLGEFLEAFTCVLHVHLPAATLAVTQLHLSAEDLDRKESIGAALQHVLLPKLTSLSLSGAIVACDILWGLLHSHRATLERLELDTVALETNSELLKTTERTKVVWRSLCKLIAAELSLRWLRIHKLSCVNWPKDAGGRQDELVLETLPRKWHPRVDDRGNSYQLERYGMTASGGDCIHDGVEDFFERVQRSGNLDTDAIL
ncbi:hypothetical protein KC343_g11199 [Hortaea werneckii]|nr:hypothetical protein KC352_g21664 [Hortaea werneckii]KAI7571974.1 hypothetical protein KC317_g1168 [Hortaea werneckii]KAI7612244.1 hypothetical protein KC346_g7926 [Hortaea werneckii]KAI7612478.1 hypothetical protein KC343_g11199 [Hortaea werneckii]KAI7651233.1 hypothetical protein KC319_g10902 [Hortaea werneckii]